MWKFTNKYVSNNTHGKISKFSRNTLEQLRFISMNYSFHAFGVLFTLGSRYLFVMCTFSWFSLPESKSSLNMLLFRLTETLNKSTWHTSQQRSFSISPLLLKHVKLHSVFQIIISNLIKLIISFLYFLINA